MPRTEHKNEEADLAEYFDENSVTYFDSSTYSRIEVSITDDQYRELVDYVSSEPRKVGNNTEFLDLPTEEDRYTPDLLVRVISGERNAIHITKKTDELSESDLEPVEKISDALTQ